MQMMTMPCELPATVEFLGESSAAAQSGVSVHPETTTGESKFEATGNPSLKQTHLDTCKNAEVNK